MHPEATPTILGAAPHADRQGERSSLETVVIATTVLTATAVEATATEAITQRHGRCLPSSVLPVAKTHRCLLNPVMVDQSTVQIVTAK